MTIRYGIYFTFEDGEDFAMSDDCIYWNAYTKSLQELNQKIKEIEEANSILQLLKEGRKI